MKAETRQTLKEQVNQMRSRLEELQGVRVKAQEEMDLLPGVEDDEDDDFYDLREYYSDSIDALDEAIWHLKDFMNSMDDVFYDFEDPERPERLGHEDYFEAKKKELNSMRADLAQQERPSAGSSFFQKLLLAFGIGKALESADQKYEEHRQERERKRRDSLFWQEAAREAERKDYGDHYDKKGDI